jgi:hypothetical protein
VPRQIGTVRTHRPFSASIGVSPPIFGQYPTISLKEALGQRSLKRGIDPLEARRAARADL